MPVGHPTAVFGARTRYDGQYSSFQLAVRGQEKLGTLWVGLGKRGQVKGHLGQGWKVIPWDLGARLEQRIPVGNEAVLALLLVGQFLGEQQLPAWVY